MKTIKNGGIEYTEQHRSLQHSNFLQLVEEFHQTFGHPALSDPQIPGQDRCDLRVSLLQEELDELRGAIKENNLQEIADALCDLQYVLNGAILEFGMKDLFPTLFQEVHNSNMSKSCATKKEADQTIQHYANQGVDAYAKESSGKYIIVREEDGKILKSINYTHVNFSKYLQ